MQGMVQDGIPSFVIILDTKTVVINMEMDINKISQPFMQGFRINIVNINSEFGQKAMKNAKNIYCDRISSQKRRHELKKQRINESKLSLNWYKFYTDIRIPLAIIFRH